MQEMQELQVRSLSWEDLLQKEMGTHSLPRKSHEHKWKSHEHKHYCLANPINCRAWEATVHGVARVGQDLATKAPTESFNPYSCPCFGLFYGISANQSPTLNEFMSSRFPFWNKLV